MMPAFGAAAARLASYHIAPGPGGLAHWVVRLFVWHAIWRVLRAVWRIPTFGPVIIIVAVLAVIALAVLRHRGARWGRRVRRGSTGAGTGTGPRDW